MRGFISGLPQKCFFQDCFQPKFLFLKEFYKFNRLVTRKARKHSFMVSTVYAIRTKNARRLKTKMSIIPGYNSIDFES